MPNPKIDLDYGEECTVARRGTVEVRVPAFPSPCDYVRIVAYTSFSTRVEIAYWSSDEWKQEDDECEAFGAIMGAIASVLDGRVLDTVRVADTIRNSGK